MNQRHYEELLGPVYVWMLGDFEAATKAADEELRSLGIGEGSAGLAIDLGCGPGIHSIALARTGFAVIAMDNCPRLLEELRQRAQGLDIREVLGDLRQFRDHLTGKADLIFCMGDTLTHLPSEDDVDELFRDVASALAPDGLFVATFRDYTNTAPIGTARFIPVRSDDNRIMTCFLEYGETTIRVSDMLHERSDGKWNFRVSSYTKIRLAPSRVVDLLERHGLQAKLGIGPGAMIRVAAMRQRPAPAQAG